MGKGEEERKEMEAARGQVASELLLGQRKIFSICSKCGGRAVEDGQCTSVMTS